MICIAWSLWNRINHKLHEGNSIHPCEAFENALSMLRSYQASCLLEISSKPKGIKWEPPPIGSYKVNVDGALIFNIQKARIGFIMRDHEGKVFLAAIIAE